MKRIVLVAAVVLFAACEEKQMEPMASDDPVVANISDWSSVDVSALSDADAPTISLDGESPEATELNSLDIGTESLTSLVEPLSVSRKMLMDSDVLSGVGLEISNLSASANNMVSMSDVDVDATELNAIGIAASSVASSLADNAGMSTRDVISKL